MNREVYIDGDVLPYQIGFVTQKVVYRLYSEGQHTAGPFLTTTSKRLVNRFIAADPDLLVERIFLVEEDQQVISTLKLHIQNIVKGSLCNTFKVVLSGKDNFREGVASILPYKGNREGIEKPYHFNLIRDWLASMPYTIISDNEEADDVISKAMIAGHVGASPDKDLNNTPGSHYNFRTNTRYEVSEKEAITNFYRQMLTGDKADNIPGIRGIGPVKAEKALHLGMSEGEMELVVYGFYERVYDDPIAAMTEVGQLLWMRREDGELWRPRYVEGKNKDEDYTISKSCAV